MNPEIPSSHSEPGNQRCFGKALPETPNTTPNPYLFLIIFINSSITKMVAYGIVNAHHSEIFSLLRSPITIIDNKNGSIQCKGLLKIDSE